MPRLAAPRDGLPLTTNGMVVPYSFWPTQQTTRQKLQRRLYVKDPWATLFEAVYRTRIPKPRSREALSYLEQAEDYFNAGIQSGGKIAVKPVLLYYSILNLAKCLLAVRNRGLDLSRAQHGLSAARNQGRAVLGDQIRLTGGRIRVFSEMMNLLEGHFPSFAKLDVRHLLAQILPAHRLWTYASGKREQFVNIEIAAAYDESDRKAWLILAADRGDLRYMGRSVNGLIKSTKLPGSWKQIHELPAAAPWKKIPLGGPNAILIEQQTSVAYTHRSLDCVQKLFALLRPALWSVVTSVYPHRKYYLNVGSDLGPRRLPQWASMYMLFFYLSDLTRYRPVHFYRFLERKYGPQVESILDECPRQFLYLMASELLQREVAPAALA